MRRLIPILLLAAVVAMFKLLPWWGSVAVVVGLGLCLKLFAWKLIEKLMLGAFKAKGAALAGADCTLHGITPTSPPKPDADAAEESDEIERGPLRWVHVDLTVHVPAERRRSGSGMPPSCSSCRSRRRPVHRPMRRSRSAGSPESSSTGTASG